MFWTKRKSFRIETYKKPKKKKYKVTRQDLPPIPDNMTAVEYIAKHKLVEKIAYKVNRHENLDDLKDGIQLIYLNLVNPKKEKFLRGMIERGQINFYLAKAVMFTIISTTSAYHTKFRNYRRNLVDIEEYMKNNGEITNEPWKKP